MTATKGGLEMVDSPIHEPERKLPDAPFSDEEHLEDIDLQKDSTDAVQLPPTDIVSQDEVKPKSLPFAVGGEAGLPEAVGGIGLTPVAVHEFDQAEADASTVREEGKTEEEILIPVVSGGLGLSPIDAAHGGGIGLTPVNIAQQAVPEMEAVESSEESSEEYTSEEESGEEVSDSPPPLVGEVAGVGRVDATPTTKELGITESSLFMSARCGEFHAILRLLTDEPNEWQRVLNMRDSDGHSLLHWACLFEHLEFIRVSGDKAVALDLKSAYIDGKSSNGQTAVMWASLKGNVESLKLLWKRFKANLVIQDSLKADAGILAVQHHQYNVILLLSKWLHDHRFHPFETQDVSGCTAVHWAAYKGDVQMLRLLHYVKTSMDSGDYQGMTPLHRAVSEGWVEAATFLTEKCGANAQLKNLKNESPADTAKRLENKVLLDLFSKTVADADVNNPFPLGNRWALPGVFVCVISATIISFFADLYPVTGAGLSVAFVAAAITAIVTYSDLVVADPGFVTRRPNGNSAIEELQNRLDGSEKLDPAELGLNKICVTCWEHKSVERRMKHCSVCDKCVEGFDHHCAWINSCVAEKNHREFVLMVLSVWIGMILFVVISVTACVRSEKSFLDFLFSKPLLIPLWFVHALVVPWITILFFHQLRSIALNMNTNELINMYRYSHFWEGPLQAVAVTQEDACGHGHGPGQSCGSRKPPGRRFKNPFDQGGSWANCKYFWCRQRAHRYEEIEMSDVSHIV